MTNIPPPWEQWWGDYTGCCTGRLTLLHWFLVPFFPFLCVLGAMLQCHNSRAVGECHLRFSFQILIAVSRSSINLTLINIRQLLIIKSLKEESLLLKLIPKSDWKQSRKIKIFTLLSFILLDARVISQLTIMLLCFNSHDVTYGGKRPYESKRLMKNA